MFRKKKKQRINQETMQQQLLYEYWLKRDTWLLRGEAVPLLLGLNPEDTEQDTDAAGELWESVRESAGKGELSVYNRQAPVETWSVSPEAIYRWAGGREMALPEPFTAIMEFIIQTVKKEGSTGEDNASHGMSFNAENELILGAALAVLSAFPQECRRDDGGIDVRRTVVLMNQNAETLFNREELGFTYERVYDLLKNWIDRLEER